MELLKHVYLRYPILIGGACVLALMVALMWGHG